MKLMLIIGLAARSMRAVKFGVVGASGVGVNTAVFWLLTSRLHVHYLFASVIAAEIALCSNYILNNNWTFADRRSHFISLSGLGRYHAVSLGGILINLGVLQVLAGPLRIYPVVANLAGIAVAMAWNFSLSLYWTWRPLPSVVSALGLNDGQDAA